ncbi:uncharacterized protein DSM5745_07757 [Aspergillus mulundensis]|uniref:NADP-dependent oxidoreductase domain-containing protein n=1 Tax=Aspergillus mulundensis TaxID=1810919 RepID=A0A3D8REV5_9EURO|nr:hypothetical protein DSM5745_07757 [Aspergillus mulundensis]RDW72585.1 hypothetical protein DSM5745_07757 [Aspergillus mulundensis]
MNYTPAGTPKRNPSPSPISPRQWNAILHKEHLKLEAGIRKDHLKRDLMALRSKLEVLAVAEQTASTGSEPSVLSLKACTLWYAISSAVLIWIPPETLALATLKGLGLYLTATGFWFCGLEFGERVLAKWCRRTVQGLLDAAEHGTLHRQKGDALDGVEFWCLGVVRRQLRRPCLVVGTTMRACDWVRQTCCAVTGPVSWLGLAIHKASLDSAPPSTHPQPLLLPSSLPTIPPQRNAPTTRTLGPNDPQIPSMGLGLGSLSGFYCSPSPLEARLSLLDHAYAIGLRFWDMANIYLDAEDPVGEWARRNPGKRDDVFVATRFGLRGRRMGRIRSAQIDKESSGEREEGGSRGEVSCCGYGNIALGYTRMELKPHNCKALNPKPQHDNPQRPLVLADIQEIPPRTDSHIQRRTLIVNGDRCITMRLAELGPDRGGARIARKADHDHGPQRETGQGREESYRQGVRRVAGGAEVVATEEPRLGAQLLGRAGRRSGPDRGVVGFAGVAVVDKGGVSDDVDDVEGCAPLQGRQQAQDPGQCFPGSRRTSEEAARRSGVVPRNGEGKGDPPPQGRPADIPDGEDPVEEAKLSDALAALLRLVVIEERTHTFERPQGAQRAEAGEPPSAKGRTPHGATVDRGGDDLEVAEAAHRIAPFEWGAFGRPVGIDGPFRANDVVSTGAINATGEVCHHAAVDCVRGGAGGAFSESRVLVQVKVRIRGVVELDHHQDEETRDGEDIDRPEHDEEPGAPDDESSIPPIRSIPDVFSPVDALAGSIAFRRVVAQR